MAIALVGSPTHKARATWDTGTTTVVRTGVAAGNLLIVTIAYYRGTGGLITVTSSPTSTWAEALRINGDANSHIAVWYAMDVAAGSTTVSFSWSDPGAGTGILEGDVLEFSSAATAAARDAFVTNTGTSTAASATSGTLAQADEVVVMMTSHTGADTALAHDTADSYTLVSENEDNDNGQAYQTQYKIVAATTSQVVNCTLGTTRAWFTGLASFKGAAGAGSTVPRKIRQYRARRE